MSSTTQLIPNHIIQPIMLRRTGKLTIREMPCGEVLTVLYGLSYSLTTINGYFLFLFINEQRMGREMTKKHIFYCFPVAKKHAKEIRDWRRVGCLRLGLRPRMRKGQEKSLCASGESSTELLKMIFTKNGKLAGFLFPVSLAVRCRLSLRCVPCRPDQGHFPRRGGPLIRDGRSLFLC